MKSITYPSRIRSMTLAIARQPEQPYRDADADRDGEADEYPALPAGGRGEKAEGGADVVHAGDIQDRQDSHEFKFQEMTGDIRLADLVRQHHERRQQQPRLGPAAIFSHAHAN